MNVSFIIASNRNVDILSKTIDSINALSNRYSFEILVYSPFSIKAKNTIWHQELEQHGPHRGFNHLVKYAIGDSIIQLVDDMAVHQDCWNAVDFINSAVFNNRKFKITTLATMHEPVRCGWPHPDGFQIPNHLCMRFPVVKQETIKEYFQGYFYHPELYYHQADAWLGFWLGEMGEPGLEANANATLHTRIAPPQNHDEVDTLKYFDLIRTFKNGNTKYIRDGSINV